jgi:hypothetical protein
MIKLFTMMGLALAFGIYADGVQAQLSTYCSEVYRDSGMCPAQQCRLACNQEGAIWDGCALGCFPKLCVELSASDCPLEECQILKGCAEKDVCYPKVDDPSLSCGEIAYTGQNVACCEGLVKRCGLEFFDGSCDMTAAKSLDGVPVCIPCGNGICNQFENRCNCPEDCQTDSALKATE